MAQLDKSNVVNGNTIEASDISALYDAFTAGGGYSVSVSGSLTGSATTATNASKLNPTLTTANATRNVLFAASSSATYENVYKSDGTKMTYNPSTNLLNTTASYAVTASYALNGGGGGGTGASLSAYTSEDATNVQASLGTWIPFAGRLALNSGAASVDIQNIFTLIPVPNIGLGRDIFVTANDITSQSPVQVGFSAGPPATLDFSGNGNDEIVFWGWVLQP